MFSIIINVFLKGIKDEKKQFDLHNIVHMKKKYMNEFMAISLFLPESDGVYLIFI